VIDVASDFLGGIPHHCHDGDVQPHETDEDDEEQNQEHCLREPGYLAAPGKSQPLPRPEMSAIGG
jgi:hypothetical protein